MVRKVQRNTSLTKLQIKTDEEINVYILRTRNAHGILLNTSKYDLQ